jgi:predicted metalloprotease with PDZ domain
MGEDTLTPAYTGALVSIIAHEFFHVNTPLNIHSELIEHFNFVKPVMSQHLWLYEGTTEWAAHVLQLRDSLITLKQYLQTMQSELNANDGYDANLSLTSLGVHSTERQDQYPNIYQKGALVSTLLDIRLLQLSHGTVGLRELLIRLSKEFGKKRSFSEERFFDQLTSMTYPEIGDFFDRYVKRTEQLPVKEYFGWMGIDYRPVGDADSTRSGFGVGLGVVNNAIGVTFVYPDSKSGLLKGDVIEKVDTTTLTFQTAGAIFGRLGAMKPGTSVTMTIKRQDKEMEVTAVLMPRVARHVFAIDSKPTPDQLKLREAWMKNM